MEHVDLDGRLEHDVEDADLSEDAEARVALQKPEAIRAHGHTGYDHPDDGGYLQPSEHHRAQKDDHEDKQEYGYGL